MFRIHILLKLVERSNIIELGKLLLLDSKTSKEVAWLLQRNLFPQLELINHGWVLKYRLTGKNGSLISLHELLEQELDTGVNEFMLNSEDTLEDKIKITNILPFNNKKGTYLKITFRREIINFIILLIESLRNKGQVKRQTYYTDSEVYFEFRNLLELLDFDLDCIWSWVGGMGGEWGFIWDD